VFSALFLLTFRVCNKEIGAKAAQKMLVELPKGVNFIIILLAEF